MIGEETLNEGPSRMVLGCSLPSHSQPQSPASCCWDFQVEVVYGHIFLTTGVPPPARSRLWLEEPGWDQSLARHRPPLPFFLRDSSQKPRGASGFSSRMACEGLGLVPACESPNPASGGLERGLGSCQLNPLPWQCLQGLRSQGQSMLLWSNLCPPQIWGEAGRFKTSSGTLGKPCAGSSQPRVYHLLHGDASSWLPH